MRKKLAETPPDPAGKRRWPRKTALLSAIVVDADGSNASDCTIRDISAGGAQICGSRTLPAGARVFLLNTDLETAYLGTVVWSKPDRCGLSFDRQFAMGSGLPHDLKFLWKVLLQTKLKKIEDYIGRGIPRGFALMNVNLTDVHLSHMRRYAQGDLEFERLMTRATRLLDDRNAQDHSAGA